MSSSFGLEMMALHVGEQTPLLCHLYLSRASLFGRYYFHYFNPVTHSRAVSSPRGIHVSAAVRSFVFHCCSGMDPYNTHPRLGAAQDISHYSKVLHGRACVNFVKRTYCRLEITVFQVFWTIMQVYPWHSVYVVGVLKNVLGYAYRGT